MTTYTAALSAGMLIAIVEDGNDIDAEVSRTADEIGAKFDAVEIVSGLTLTDAPEDGDHVVYSGFEMGRLTDKHGVEFEYAVKRVMPVLEYSPDAARELRRSAGWTQAQAAEAVHYQDKARWSEIERGVQRPSGAVWELALIKSGLHPDYCRR